MILRAWHYRMFALAYLGMAVAARVNYGACADKGGTAFFGVVGIVGAVACLWMAYYVRKHVEAKK